MARTSWIKNVWANAAALIDRAAPTDTIQNNGYSAEIPPYEDFNWIFNKYDSMLQSLEKNGFMEWSTDTIYVQHGKCTGSDGVVYKAVIANDGNDPITDNGTNWLPWLQTTSNPFMNYMLVKDEKANGVDGGTFTAGSYQVRDFTIAPINNITGASLAANQITLPAGIYRIKATAPAHSSGVNDKVLQHRVKIFSAGGIDLIGRNAFIDTSSSPSTGGTSDAKIDDDFEITAAMVSGGTNKIELRHRCGVTQATNGFGKACSFGTEKEYYSQAEIWQIG